jgi:hypothetical protein
MAMLIFEDGSAKDVTPADLKRGCTLAELYSELGCDVVEVLWLQSNRRLVIDENGKIADRQVDELATALAREVLQAEDVIVGPAILCSRQEFR